MQQVNNINNLIKGHKRTYAFFYTLLVLHVYSYWQQFIKKIVAEHFNSVQNKFPNVCSLFKGIICHFLTLRDFHLDQ